MKNQNVKELLIKVGIMFYLLITPVAILLWARAGLQYLPMFFSNKGIIGSMLFLGVPVLLILSAVFFIVKSEYVIVTFLMYTLISIVQAIKSQIVVIDGVISFFNFGGLIINFCILIYMVKLGIQQKYRYKMHIPEKLKIFLIEKNIYSEIKRRHSFNLLAICTGFLAVLAVAKIAYVLTNNALPVTPDTIDTLLLLVALVSYLVAGVLYFKESEKRWIPYLVAVFLALIKTIHIFHYFQISMVLLALLYLSVEWKLRGKKELLPDEKTM